MADQLIVKLGADTSEFKGKIAEAGQAVSGALGSQAGSTAGDRFVGAFEHRLLGARHLSGALATALGLNIEHIAENIARFITGVTKDEEEALKESINLTTKLTDITKKAMESQLSDEKLYQLKLGERESLLKKLEGNQGRTQQERNEATKIQIALEENVMELNQLQVKLQEQSNKEQEHLNQLLAEYDRQKDEIDRKARAELEEAKRQDQEYADHQKKNADELRDLKIQEMKPEEKLNALTQEREELAQSMNKLQKNSTEYSDAQVKLAKLDNEISKDTLEVKKDITQEIKEQVKALNDSITNTPIGGDLGVAKVFGGIKISPDAGRQYDYDQALLASATRDTQRDIDTLQKQIDTYQSGGAGIGKFELPALQARLKALQGRQSHIQDYVFNPRYQDAAGQGLFAQQVATIGDPLKLQAQQTDALKTVSKGIADINERLRLAGFGTNGTHG